MQSKPDSHQNLTLSEKIGKKNMKKRKKKKKKKKKKHEMQGPSTPNLLQINLPLSFTLTKKKKFLYLFNGLGEYPGLICDFTPTFI